MADPLSTLVEGIVAIWRANDDSSEALNGINGPYFGDKPPEDGSSAVIGFPYVLIETKKSLLDFTTDENEYWLHPDFSFAVYDKTPELVKAMIEDIRSIFDPDALAISLGQGSVVRKRCRGTEFIQADQKVWKGIVSYEFLTSRARS